jgi:NAD(P)-dependent dehydrogenase (short-subunit alcohol dehydrogenase family)
LEGFIQALQTEVAPNGINTTIVNPGFFRTELLTEQSTKYADNPIPTGKREHLMQFWKDETVNKQVICRNLHVSLQVHAVATAEQESKHFNNKLIPLNYPVQ